MNRTKSLLISEPFGKLVLQFKSFECLCASHSKLDDVYIMTVIFVSREPNLLSSYLTVTKILIKESLGYFLQILARTI